MFTKKLVQRGTLNQRRDLQYYLGHKRVDSTLNYFKYTTKQRDSFYEKIGLRRANSQNASLAKILLHPKMKEIPISNSII